MLGYSCKHLDILGYSLAGELGLHRLKQDGV